MKHVLVVEDDQDIVDLLTIHLKDMNLEVEVAYDGPRVRKRHSKTPMILLFWTSCSRT